MDPLETMKALGELWGKGSQAFLSAQQTMFGDLSARMAKAAGGDGTPTEAFQPEMQSFELARQAFGKAMASAMELSATVAKTLKPSDGKAPDPVAAEIMGKIFDPRGWFGGINEMDEALARMAEGPRLADLWNIERKFAAVFTAWVALRRRTLEHNTVILDAWTKAAGIFAKVLNERTDKGETAESWRELMSSWVETANKVLIEHQRTESFLKSQREVLKASTDLRLAQQEVAAFYSEMFGYPTRAELDDVHKTVTELRRELRALKRAAKKRKGAEDAHG